MNGWCPIHDRVYEAEDGRCPLCGTALVAEEDTPPRQRVVIDAAAPAPEVDAPALEPAPRRGTTVVGIAAAVVVAFVAGLAFPDRSTDEGVPRRPVEAKADLNVGTPRTLAHVTLRLESFTQHGRRIVARVSVPATSDIRLADLRSAGVTLSTGAGEFGEHMAVRPTVSGFILQGLVLPRAEISVLGIRIETLNFVASGRDEIPLDLGGVWPASERNQPRAGRATGTLEPLEGRRFTVTGVIGWMNRLDIGMTESHTHPDWYYEEDWTLVSGSTAVPSHTGSGELLTFLDVPGEFRRVRLVVSVRGLNISGPWAWQFV